MAIGSAIVRVPKEAKKGEVVRIQMVITHPMESGGRRDPQTGQTIPAYHLTKLEIFFNNNLLTAIDMGGGLSANPFVGITMKAEQSGVIKIVYQDNKDGKWERTAEVNVT